LRKAGFWLAALAVLMKAWLPSGYMAAVDDANKLTIVLCGLGDQTEMILDLATGALTPAEEAPDHGGDHDEDDASAASCVFALASAADLAPPDAGAVAPGVYHPERIPADASAPVDAQDSRPPLPPRGPPSFA
jgi:hypothetical protein